MSIILRKSSSDVGIGSSIKGKSGKDRRKQQRKESTSGKDRHGKDALSLCKKGREVHQPYIHMHKAAKSIEVGYNETIQNARIGMGPMRLQNFNGHRAAHGVVDDISIERRKSYV